MSFARWLSRLARILKNSLRGTEAGQPIDPVDAHELALERGLSAWEVFEPAWLTNEQTVRIGAIILVSRADKLVDSLAAQLASGMREIDRKSKDPVVSVSEHFFDWKREAHEVFEAVGDDDRLERLQKSLMDFRNVASEKRVNLGEIVFHLKSGTNRIRRFCDVAA